MHAFFRPPRFFVAVAVALPTVVADQDAVAAAAAVVVAVAAARSVAVVEWVEAVAVEAGRAKRFAAAIHAEQIAAEAAAAALLVHRAGVIASQHWWVCLECWTPFDRQQDFAVTNAAAAFVDGVVETAVVAEATTVVVAAAAEAACVEAVVAA